MEYGSGFDYEKYIWQIQFHPVHSFPGKYSYNTTIDYLKRVLIIRRTNADTKRTKTKEIKLMDNSRFEELLRLSEISKIREFERKSDDELRNLDMGYRDGWKLHYCYFTHDDPPMTEGVLGTVYKGNPIEGIDKWIHQYATYDEVGF